MLKRLWKPWYVRRPHQIALRAWRSRCGGCDRRIVRLPWGLSIEVNIRETIGRSIWQTGVYDLAVTEALFRLIDRGDLLVDAGANIGYMAGVMGICGGPTSTLMAFEPHPDICGTLRGNLSRFRINPDFADGRVVEAALSSTSGTALLTCNPGFARNEGTAALRAAGFSEMIRGEQALQVSTMTLDELISTEHVGLLKLDVEGHELEVLRGAARLLTERRIRHILYEDHDGPSSSASGTLSARGYTIFRLGWTMKGPVIGSANGPALARSYEAPSYLATIAPELAAARMMRRGWRCFQYRSHQRRVCRA